MTEWIIYVVVVLLIIAAVWSWHANADKIAYFMKGGPRPEFSKGGIVPQQSVPTLSQRVDLMHKYRDLCREQASALEFDINAARADVDEATKKLLPPQA